MMRTFCWCLIISCAIAGTGAAAVPTQVVLQTNFGDIVLELYPEQAPITVQNFLDYANSHFYDSLIFHRVIEDFMIQSGGYDTRLRKQPTNPPIINESYNGLSNICGTIAMARTSDPDSATSEFFINQNNNLFLDKQYAEDGYGYCVFGQVTSGMNVVDDIAGVETGTYQGFYDIPMEWVIIHRARLCVYVTPTGNDTTGTGALDKPFRTIQKALNTVSEPTSIMVAPGTYYEKINFNGKNVGVTSLDPTDPSIVATTIIDAGHTGRPVTFAGTETSVAEFSGFTIKNGSATTGGAIYGGTSGCHAAIHSNVIFGNSATNGGAIANCDGAIHHNVIRGNSATSLGGGLYACDGRIYNNTVYGNTASNGGGLANCGQAQITNCIVWGNAPAEQVYDSAVPYAEPTHSCIQNRTGGFGNISRDPLFADAGNGDLHLKSQGYRYNPQSGWVQDAATSPCIDTGSCGFSHENELLGPGTENLRVNMGAYGNKPQASIALAGWGLASDINNDGVGDSADIVLIAQQWLHTAEHSASDINTDGLVNGVDFAVCAFERFKTAGWCWSQPDLSGDGSVNFVDFAQTAANWQKSGTGLAGDFDADGVVNARDMAFFSAAWLK